MWKTLNFDFEANFAPFSDVKFILHKRNTDFVGIMWKTR